MTFQDRAFTGEAPLTRTYPPDLQPLLQSLLATLADMDFAFERELAAVMNTTGDVAAKRKTICKLRERHQESRAPYVEQLCLLQDQIKELTA